jgi:hypothetical protein
MTPPAAATLGDRRPRGIAMTDVAWPQKRRELHDHHFDSTV